ncbi:MAG: hypothetical protein IJI27_09820 [Oscillospiraceae bacterium]|nr:hypothetical protein [Oscillospiraceae bacterium]
MPPSAFRVIGRIDVPEMLYKKLFLRGPHQLLTISGERADFYPQLPTDDGFLLKDLLCAPKTLPRNIKKVDGCECVGPMDMSWTKELDR